VRRRIRGVVAAAACAVVVVALAGQQAGANAAQIGAPAAPAPPPKPVLPDRVADPDRVLGPAWRSSPDRVVTTAGDDTGLHVLVADRRDAYRWRIATTLAEPGLDTDLWIGRACVTGSGRRAVVVYAPRQFANREALLGGGAFAAVVDLVSGTVTKLAERTTMAYYNPGCGAGETAALSRLSSDERTASTSVSVVDAAAARVVRTVRASGELTSPLPLRGRIVGAYGGGLVELTGDGTTRLLAATTGTPYRIVPDGTDRLAFQLPKGNDTIFARYAGGMVTAVTSAPAGTAVLHPGAAGRVFLVGPGAPARLRGRLPVSWEARDGAPGADVSTNGDLLVTSANPHAPGKRLQISARLAAGTDVSFDTDRSAVAGSARSPALRRPATAAPARPGVADYSGVPSDPDRTCAVPRNDPLIQVYQPGPRQVEWAADLAVRGQLTFTRPANWLNNGLPAYSPQQLFPPAQMDGFVPAQVLLGILAQESNLRQASWHVVDGSSGNPLTSPGFYGLDPTNPDPNKINWASADCGYGVAQITTGMRSVDTNAAGGLSDLQQKAIALDYATNIAAAVRLLQDKWNQAKDHGIVANNGDPKYIENWFFAVWAYNTGLHEPLPHNDTAPWGLGWLNNPANPIYPADRKPFLTAPLTTPTHHDLIAYDNAKHASDWSYPERVMGWARTSVVLPDYASGDWKSTYAPGLWPGDIGGDQTDPTQFIAAQPGRFTFCVPNFNHCDPAVTHKSSDPQYADQPPGPCTMNDLTQCWWHDGITWIDCTQHCGVEVRSFTTVEPRPLADNIHPEQCTVEDLPDNAIIIDDIVAARPTGPNGCNPVPAGGNFSLDFASTSYNGTTIHPSKVDFHQIGGGFGGHFWFAHTQPTTNPTMRVTGTWTPTNRLTGWTRILVHIPDHGAGTQQAHYVIHTGLTDRERYLNTNRQANNWIELGTYQFGGGQPQGLELSNFTDDGRGVDDITWDAAAFVPLPGKPQHFVVAIGDSYQSGEGVGDYYPETDADYSDYSWNACRRSRQAWPRTVTLPGTNSPVGTLADGLDARLDFQFVSCSGAKAEMMVTSTSRLYWTNPPSLGDLHADADGQFGEHAQVDSGVLSDDTTLVLLSAGGNDADFPGWIRTCAQSDCTGDQAQIQQDIDQAQQKVLDLMTAVHDKAPNAKIVLVGYPRLFADDHGGTCLFRQLTGAEMDMMQAMADHMRDVQAATVNTARSGGIDANFVDMVAGFGDHGTCRAFHDADPGPTQDINEVLIYTTGPGDYRAVSYPDPVPYCPINIDPLHACVSRSSFHPMRTGADRYATAVSSGLAAIGYH
jgi:hypothetical protein